MKRLDVRTLLDPVPAAALLFAAGTALLSLTALVQLGARGGFDGPLPLSQPHLDRAAALLAPDRAPGPADLAGAEREVRAALATSPMRTDAWLMLAYVERSKAGAWSPAVEQALAQSYVVGALDPEVSFWRIRFCYENWSDLPPELRAKAAQEVRAVWYRWPARERMAAIAGELGDPAGRLALNLELAALHISRRG